MKYLHSRDNYLKKINERNNIELEKRFDLLTNKLILEENEPGSGAFGNNVRWGDSLLGRFINFVIRKIGVGIDMGRISLVSNSLRSQFDRMLTDSTISSLSEETKQEVSKVQMSAILGVLKKAVDDGEKVGKLKEITQFCIDDIEALEVSEASKDAKEKVLNALEGFLEFLEKFKDSEGQGGPLTEDAEKTEDEDEDAQGQNEDEGSSSGGKLTLKTAYPTMIKNIKALSLVLSNYKKFNPDSIKRSDKAGANDFYTTAGGETIDGIQKDSKINKNKLTSEQIWNKNKKVLQPYEEKAVKSKLNKYTLQLAKGLKLEISAVNESFIFEDGPIGTSNVGSKAGIGTGGGIDRNKAVKIKDKDGNVIQAEDHLTQAYSKIKKACEILESSKEKGIGVNFEFLKLITDKSVSDEGKVAVKGLYREVLRYLIGDKKATLNAPQDPLFKESIEIISDKNKKVIVAEKIARFTMRALQFDGENLYGSLGDLGKPLKEFVDTMKELKKVDPESLKVEKKESGEKKNENRLLKYNSYLQLIKEADEDKSGDEEDDKDKPEGEDSEDRSKEISKEIKDFFDENLGDYEVFLLSEEEAKKVEKEIEEASKDRKSIVINGMNPIIEIVRLFNRAYKLHTTDVIPGDRSGGKVDRLTYNEYEKFGSTSGEPSATEHGPYRHKKTFNIWENAVMDCLGDTKYAPIFAKETTLDDGAGNIKEGAGVALRRFMLDMLDGDTLYKGSGSGSSDGAQKRALNEYFGEVSEKFFEENSDVKLGMKDKKTGKTDDEIVSDTADSIEVSTLQFVKASKVSSGEIIKENKFTRTFFQMNGKEGDKIRTYYVFVRETDGDNFYLMISKTFFYFKEIVKSKYPSINVEKGDSTNTPEVRSKDNTGNYPVIHTKISKRDLQALAVNSLREIKIDGLIKQVDKPKTESVDFKLTEVNWVCAIEDKKPSVVKFSKDEELDIANILKLQNIRAVTFEKIKEVVNRKYDDNKFTPLLKRK